MMPIIAFEGVSFRYPAQGGCALQGLDLALPDGERIVFIGRNGSGKSTVFRHATGLYRPYSGVVRFAGQELRYDRRSLRWLRQHIGIVFQNPDDQLFSASVRQDISFGPLNLGLDRTETTRRVQTAAEQCEIVALLDRPTHALSGGEKTRVALAGVLAMEPQVLIADELLANLDPWGRQSVLGILDRLHRQGKTLILAAHNLEMVQTWATFVVVMHEGRAAYAGAPAGLLADGALMAATGLAQVWPKAL